MIKSAFFSLLMKTLLVCLPLSCVLVLGQTPALADGAANAFNPYTGKAMPSSRKVKGEDSKILEALGGTQRSIATDAAYRPHWKEEAYPVLKGTRDARHEVLFVLDMADPAARPLWKTVRAAMDKLPVSQARLVLFARSAEVYATDLAGLAIWACRERPGQAMTYLSWVLQRWDDIKSAQRRKGSVRPFNNEYDAVLSRKDYPMAFVAMNSCFKPRVPEKDQSRLAAYIYEAGNINLYQATEVCRYYELETPSGLIVDGKVVDRGISASALKALLR